MKSKIAIKVYLLITLLFNFSCNNSDITNSKLEKPVYNNNFVFQGIMHKAEGLEISVYYPSHGFDARYSAVIQDSTYTITYPKRDNEIITLIIEDAVRDDHSSIWMPTFIAEDTIIFECTMDSLLGRFLVPKECKIIQGDLSIKYREKQKEFFTYFNPKQKGLDSLDKKQSILKGYKNLYAGEPKAFHSVYSLFQLLYKGRIQLNDFSEDQIAQINYYFNNLSKQYEGNYYYDLVKQKIYGEVAQVGSEFRSFLLEDVEGRKIDIKSLTKGKNLVLIEFWHSRCGPCRAFNKSFKRIYNKYSEFGFEIISVNTDKSKNDWLLASRNDSISWVNLYAGQNSKIESYFEVQAYPTKAIYTDSLRLIKFGRIGESEVEEILCRKIPAIK